MDAPSETDRERAPTSSPQAGLAAGFERAILLSRWLQLPFLIGLIGALFALMIAFGDHLFGLVAGLGQSTRIQVILLALDLVDMVLIANLVVMVLISGYKIFISPINLVDESNVPGWLSRTSPGALKLRIATTVLLISTIHLLHLYLDPEKADDGDAEFMLLAQLVFAITTVVFVLVEWAERHRER